MPIIETLPETFDVAGAPFFVVDVLLPPPPQPAIAMATASVAAAQK
jgi:hypothetical protein